VGKPYVCADCYCEGFDTCSAANDIAELEARLKQAERERDEVKIFLKATDMALGGEEGKLFTDRLRRIQELTQAESRLEQAVRALRYVREKITNEAMDELDLAGWCEGVDFWLAEPWAQAVQETESPHLAAGAP